MTENPQIKAPHQPGDVLTCGFSRHRPRLAAAGRGDGATIELSSPFVSVLSVPPL
jgi:hypothetical protein